MASPFHKNAILTGSIDSYCLVCEDYLQSEQDIANHIIQPGHRKNLEGTGHFEKYKDDCVRKVKKVYYCEFCNTLLATTAKVGLHISDEKHINNKGTQLLKRDGNLIVAFNDMLIYDKAWHGIIEDTCVLCNTEFDDEGLHKAESIHILNLVQNKVKFGPGKSIYRKIDDSSFQCLTCNRVLASPTITTHFEETTHKMLADLCRIDEQTVKAKSGNTKKDDIKMTKAPTAKESKEKPTETHEGKSTETKLGAKKETDNAFLAPETPENDAKKAAEKKPKTNEINNDKKPSSAEKQTSDTKKAEKPKLIKASVELDKEICKALSAKDYISHDGNGRKWCLLCDWTMENISITNHVNGKHHQTLLKMHRERMQTQVAAEPTAVENIAPKTEKELNDADGEKVKIIDAVTRFQNNEINIDFAMNKAFCKKCSKHIDFKFKSIENHIEEHKKTPVKTEVAKPVNAVPQKPEEKKTKNKEERKAESRASSVASSVQDQDEEIEKLVKANDLAYNRGGKRVYCKACDSPIPSTLKNIKEHVSGMSHKSKVVKWMEYNKQSAKNVTMKTPMHVFIKTMVGVADTATGDLKDVILNEKFCINLLSFMMVTNRGRLRCESCDVNLSLEQLERHKTSLSHEKAMTETLVVVSSDTEFIREMRPGILHCGFCNLVAPEEDFPSHLASTFHREAKTSSTWRLQEYNYEMVHQHNPMQQGLEWLLLIRMLAGSGAL